MDRDGRKKMRMVKKNFSNSNSEGRRKKKKMARESFLNDEQEW